MSKAIVFGPSIHGTISGHGWVKYNIVLALMQKYETVISVSMGKQDTPLEQSPSSEERGNKPVPIFHQSISSAYGWSNLVSSIEPELIVVVGDPEFSYFVPFVEYIKENNVKIVYYYISEALTMNRYLPAANGQYINLKTVFDYYDAIIPATSLTVRALENDMQFKFKVKLDPITPPVWKWNTSKEKNYAYRDKIAVEYDSKIHFAIARNNIRKRIDQILLMYRNKLLLKPCCRLVLHTNLDPGGYDILAIAGRLGISGNLVVNQDMSLESIEGIFSAGDVYINLPAAEGYGLGTYEALLLGKQVIHTDVGYFAHESQHLKNCHIDIVDAPIQYFAPSSEQVWRGTSRDYKTTRRGKKGDFTIEEVINTPEQFRVKFLDAVSRVIQEHE